MKKLYILLVAVMVTFISFGQELLVNGDLEAWDDATTPSSWTKAEALTQETTDFHGGANAAKRDGGTGTKDLAQEVTVVAGDSYTVTMWYKVTAGDGDDARIWAVWKSGGTTMDNANQSPELKGPNNAYLPNNGGVWTEYTATVVAPATADALFFEVRSYSNSTVIWDDLSVFHNATVPTTLSISSPTEGSTEGTGDVTVNYNITGFNVAPTDGTGDGHFHYMLTGPTAIASTPVFSNTGTLDLTGLMPGAYTLFMDLRDDSHVSLSPAVEATVNFSVQSYTQVANIADLRIGNIGDGYELTDEALINYAQSHRNQKWIQDATAGILIDDTSGNITAGVRGDGLSGLKGTLGEYKGMLQFIPTADATVVSPSTVTITPQEVTLADLATNFEDYEAELVKVVNVILADYDDGGAGTADGTFQNGNVYPMDQSGDAFNFRTSFYSVDYTGTTFATTALDIVGLPGEKTGSGTFDYGVVFTARDLADITANTVSVNDNTIAGFAIYPNPVSNGVFTIDTAQNLEKKVAIFSILGKQVINTTITGNTVNVAHLNAGIYLVKVIEAGNTVTRKLVIK